MRRPPRLSPADAVLWARVASTVTPLEGRTAPPSMPAARTEPPLPRLPLRPTAVTPAPPPKARQDANTLDAGWDRRLGRGIVRPDMTVDLHGDTLTRAHARLEAALARAIAHDVRVLLLITGKPPREEGHHGVVRRGVIRANVPGWLAASAHRERIAAVRGAHPRHGGAGALYIVLRRRRDR